MKAFKKILYPVVFSKSSEDIVPFIQLVAGQFKAQIHLLFVVEVCESFSVIQPEKEVILEAERRLLEFKDRHFSAFSGTLVSVVAGDAWEEIIYYIHSKCIDLIIIGTYGRKDFDNNIFGSVAERVIKTAPIPVMVVNPFRMLNDGVGTDIKSTAAETLNRRQLNN